MEPEIITKRMVGECSSSVTDSTLTAYQNDKSRQSLLSLHMIVTYDQIIVRTATRST